MHYQKLFMQFIVIMLCINATQASFNTEIAIGKKSILKKHGEKTEPKKSVILQPVTEITLVDAYEPDSQYDPELDPNLSQSAKLSLGSSSEYDKALHALLDKELMAMQYYLIRQGQPLDFFRQLKSDTAKSLKTPSFDHLGKHTIDFKKAYLKALQEEAKKYEDNQYDLRMTPGMKFNDPAIAPSEIARDLELHDAPLSGKSSHTGTGKLSYDRTNRKPEVSQDLDNAELKHTQQEKRFKRNHQARQAYRDALKEIQFKHIHDDSDISNLFSGYERPEESDYSNFDPYYNQPNEQSSKPDLDI